MSDQPHSLPPHQWLPPAAPEPVPAADPVPPTRGERKERRARRGGNGTGRGGGAMALLLAAVAKGKALLLLLPKLKVLTTSGSMLVWPQSTWPSSPSTSFTVICDSGSRYWYWTIVFALRNLGASSSTSASCSNSRPMYR